MASNPSLREQGRQTGSTTPPSSSAMVGRVLLPVEGSSQELLAQEYAVELASQLAVPLEAIHVSNSPTKAPDDIFQYVDQLCRRRAVPFGRRFLHGMDVVQEMADEAVATDIIVIGTRALGKGYHLGSVAEGLIRRAPCPVHVVRLGEAQRSPAQRRRQGRPTP